MQRILGCSLKLNEIKNPDFKPITKSITESVCDLDRCNLNQAKPYFSEINAPNLKFSPAVVPKLLSSYSGTHSRLLSRGFP